jgi:hypothetical protein
MMCHTVVTRHPPNMDIICTIHQNITMHTHRMLPRNMILCTIHNTPYSWDSVVGIATGYGLDDWGVGFWVPIWSRIFSPVSRPTLGSTQPPVQWVPGALSPLVKRPEHEDNHSPPTSAEVKKMWIYTSTSTCICMVWCLVRHRDKFTFTFT